MYLVTLKQHIDNIKLTYKAQIFDYQNINQLKFNIAIINNYLMFALQ